MLLIINYLPPNKSRSICLVANVDYFWVPEIHSSTVIVALKKRNEKKGVINLDHKCQIDCHIFVGFVLLG